MKLALVLRSGLLTALAAAALATAARAEVTNVTVGVHTTCPYGLIA